MPEPAVPPSDAARAPAPDDLLLVGRVVKAHGLRGEIKVAPVTDDLARLEAVETLYLGRAPEEAAPHPVAALRFQQTKRGPLALLQLGDTDTREAAEALRKLAVYAAEADLPPLEEDEVFIHDLIGLEVVSEEGEAVGTVKDLLRQPAHDVYVIAREGRPDALVPAVEAFVVDLDLDAGRLVIRPIEGLL